MIVEILHVPDCPNTEVAREHLRAALDAAGLVATIREIEVATPDAAARLGMRGSPTILIDGDDPFDDGGTPTSLSCRLFTSAGSLVGAPSATDLAAALAGKDQS